MTPETLYDLSVPSEPERRFAISLTGMSNHPPA